MSEELTAFIALANVAIKARAHAKGLPAQRDVKPFWSGIGFQLFGQRFVAPLAEVTEMLDLPHSTQLPGVQPWVRGVANVRGRLLPLTDLAAFLGGKLEAPRKQRRVLVIETGDIFSGLVVDAVWGIQHFPVDTYVPEMVGIEYQAMIPYLQGSFRTEGSADWIVLSPWSVLRDEKFFQASLTG